MKLGDLLFLYAAGAKRRHCLQHSNVVLFISSCVLFLFVLRDSYRILLVDSAISSCNCQNTLLVGERCLNEERDTIYRMNESNLHFVTGD